MSIDRDPGEAISEPPGYPLDDTVVADTPAHLKALAEPVRSRILDLVLERAATVAELAEALDRPKSSVAYHVQALVKVGLLKVVRTRKVRAVEERFYGRTGRTIVVGDAAVPTNTAGANFLTEAAAEARPGADSKATLRHARISEDQAEEFFERVVALAEEFTRLPRGGDTVIGFIGALYRTDHPTLPPSTADAPGPPGADEGTSL